MKMPELQITRSIYNTKKKGVKPIEKEIENLIDFFTF